MDKVEEARKMMNLANVMEPPNWNSGLKTATQCLLTPSFNHVRFFPLLTTLPHLGDYWLSGARDMIATEIEAGQKINTKKFRVSGHSTR